MIREHFLPLPLHPLAAGAGLVAVARSPVAVTFESDAREVMTDLRRTQAITIEPGATIDEANTEMIRHGVRLLFVLDRSARIAGLITATDILGEKVVQAMHTRGVPRAEVRVREIMTPREQLEAIDVEDVRGAKVGHILATLKEAGRQHAIVVQVHQPTFRERLASREEICPQAVCGLFSVTQIARQLGLQPQSVELATTFAEVEALLAH